MQQNKHMDILLWPILHASQYAMSVKKDNPSFKLINRKFKENKSK